MIDLLLPPECKDCDFFTSKKMDDRVDAPARYPGDRTLYGDVYFIPFCLKLQDTCPEKIKDCPKN